MPLALAYCRQSLAQDADGEKSISTAAQERRIRDAAGRAAQVVEGVYQDVDVRGHTASRVGLDALLDRIRRGGVAAVWVYDVSRLAREVEVFSALFAQIERAGCQLLSVREPTEERWLLHLHAALAMRERDALSDRVGDAMRERARLGQAIGAVALGYERVPVVEAGGRTVRRLRPTPLSAFVLSCFRRYDAGDSVSSLARWMNEPGHPKPPRAARWSVPSVRWLLRNRAYAGDVVVKASKRHPEIVVPDAHEAIVPRALFDRVQRRLDAAGNRETVRIRKPMRHWLEGRVFCACGSPMSFTVRHHSTDGHALRSWVCRRANADRNLTGGHGCCPLARSEVGNRRVEPKVVAALARDVARMVRRDDRALAALADRGDAGKAEAERRLADVRQRRRTLARSFEVVDDASALVARDNELAAEEKTLAAAVARIRPPVTAERLRAFQRGLADVRETVQRSALVGETEGLRAVAATLGVRVEVDGPNYSIDVQYADPYGRLVGRS
jgi:DNA invertase Pin-like site-specific DNA recombinase